MFNQNSPIIQQMIADGTFRVPSAVMDDNGNMKSMFYNGPLPTITTETTPEPTDIHGQSLLQQNVPGFQPQQQFNLSMGYPIQQPMMPQQGFNNNPFMSGYQQQSFNPAMGFPMQQQGYIMYGGLPFPASQSQMPINNFQFGQYNPQQPQFGQYNPIQPQMGFGFPSNVPQIASGYFHYNPYMAGSQQSVYETQMREQRRQQTDIWVMCAECATHYLGIEMSEEEIREIFDPEVKEKKLMEEMSKPKKKSKLKAVLMEGDEVYVNPDFKKKVEEEKAASGYSQLEQQAKLIKEDPSILVPDKVENFYKMYNIQTRALPYNLANVRYVQNMISIYEQAKKEYPDTMSLYSFLDSSHQMWIEMLEREQLRQYGGKLDILYDSEAFRQGVRMRSPLNSRFAPDAPLQYPAGTSQFTQEFMAANGRPMVTNRDYTDWTGISINPDLGCLEVTVPERIRKHQMTYGEARNHFLSTISRQGGEFNNG